MVLPAARAACPALLIVSVLALLAVGCASPAGVSGSTTFYVPSPELTTGGAEATVEAPDAGAGDLLELTPAPPSARPVGGLPGAPVGGSVRAQDAGGDAADLGVEDDRWTWALAPYLWMSGLKGQVTAKGTSNRVDATFSDLLDDLDFAGQLVLSARKDDVTAIVDVTHLSLSTDDKAGGARIETDTDIWLAQTHIAKDLEESGKTRGFLGARYWNLNLDIDINTPAPAPNVNADGSRDWVDPIVGVRKTWDLDDVDRWHLSTYADYGGFGIGDASDKTYQLVAMFNRKTESGNSLALGYRFMRVDYSNGSGANRFDWNVRMYGPVVGWVFRF